MELRRLTPKKIQWKNLVRKVQTLFYRKELYVIQAVTFLTTAPDPTNKHVPLIFPARTEHEKLIEQATKSKINIVVQEKINETVVHVTRTAERPSFNTPCIEERLDCRFGPVQIPEDFDRTLVILPDQCHCHFPFQHFHYEHLPSFMTVPSHFYAYILAGLAVATGSYIIIVNLPDDTLIGIIEKEGSAPLQSKAITYGWTWFLVLSTIEVAFLNYVYFLYYFYSSSGAHIPTLKWDINNPDRCFHCTQYIYDSRTHILKPLKNINKQTIDPATVADILAIRVPPKPPVDPTQIPTTTTIPSESIVQTKVSHQHFLNDQLLSWVVSTTELPAIDSNNLLDLYIIGLTFL